ncbi:preprotein translocase subunit SecE [Treponema sp.]|uniref:preprotein translocase subunit SecE n=1 Tax=Treponema sp. TaxID=166 RepID=UPI0025FD7644|nr:preprotein translocase subunit SecE [Treponema sp.]MBQ8678380.1 preprotein translocase subunit SecE [Treponema sp.]
MAKVFGFFKECGAELRKVTWPTRDDVVSSVKVVLISTIIIAVILGALDLLFSAGMSLIFKA